MTSPRDVAVVRSSGALAGTAVLRVAIGATASQSAAIGRYRRFAVYVPSTFDGTVVTVQVSHDNITFADLRDSAGTVVKLGGTTVAVSSGYPIPDAIAAWPYMRLVCTTSQATTVTDFVLLMKD